MRWILSSLALAVAAAAPVMGQGQRPVELGLDAGFGYKVNSPTVFTAAVPVQSFRAGFFTSDRLSIEPRLSWNLLAVDGESTLASISGELGALIHFNANHDRPRGYIRPLVALNVITGGGETGTQVSAGGAIGVKLPVQDRLAVRLEGGFRHGFSSSDFAEASTVFAQIGFSFLIPR